MLTVTHAYVRTIQLELECEKFSWDIFDKEEHDAAQLRQRFFTQDNAKNVRVNEDDAEAVIRNDRFPAEMNDKEMKKDHYHFVERIITHQSPYGYKFFVKWRGFGHEYDT